tara:strand:- start:2816 stop:3376 length:561 start_codon:yes stop_codon:yes gene_type:complete
MFVLVENNLVTKTVNSHKGITIDENQYPQSIYTLWSSAEREAIGIYEVVYDNTNKKDEAYYNNTNQSFNFADGKVTASYGAATAKSLDDTTDEQGNAILGLKSQHKEKVKQQASSLLNPTDWHVVKATEVDSYSVSAEMTTYRAAVRTSSNDMETKIDAASDVDALAALYVHVDGTRPLGEFPEAV